MTNKAWSFSVNELKQGLGLASLVVVNDFAATARAIPHLSRKDHSRDRPAGAGKRKAISP